MTSKRILRRKPRELKDVLDQRGALGGGGREAHEAVQQRVLQDAERPVTPRVEVDGRVRRALRLRHGGVGRLRDDVAVLRLGDGIIFIRGERSSPRHRRERGPPEPRRRRFVRSFVRRLGRGGVHLVLHRDPSLEDGDPRRRVRDEHVDGVLEEQTGAEPRGNVPGVRAGVGALGRRRFTPLLTLITLPLTTRDVPSLFLLLVV
mmetsp:Transcript_11339/g.45763  ORF Transcript_11339/g.45763 Transcript_11339/m.45763 type:complete len:204 (+) Transcript_11339:1858-2469(+)